MFENELKYFIANQDDLVRRFLGKVLILKGMEVVGVFETPLQAYLEAKRRFESGTYMLQPCVPGPGAYTVTISEMGLNSTKAS